MSWEDGTALGYLIGITVGLIGLCGLAFVWYAGRGSR